MPELPDIEGYRRYLARHAAGERIVRVELPDPQIIRNRTPAGLGRALKGRRFVTPRRHGKWLIAPLGDELALLMHFGMTGHLTWGADPGHRDRHDRAIFVCDGGELRYNNMRRFGGIWLARDERECLDVTGSLGPDAASLTRDEFDRLLSGRRGAIKPLLMDQGRLAGIGNLLSDEILWRARIHPATPVARLGRARRERLYGAIHEAVSDSIPYGRIPREPGWLTAVRDDPDGVCPRCATRLRHGTIGGRTSCWCPREQRR